MNSVFGAVIGGLVLWTCKPPLEESAGLATALALGGGSSGPARPHPETANASAASSAKGSARRSAAGLEIGINVETPNRRRHYSEKRRVCERRLDRSSDVPGGRAAAAWRRGPCAGHSERIVRLQVDQKVSPTIISLLAHSALACSGSGA